MDMRTHLLTRLSRAEDTNDGDFWSIVTLRKTWLASEYWVKFSRSSLVVVDTVETKAKSIH